MTKVRTARCAERFGTNHSVAPILFRLHLAFADRLPEARPPTAGIEFFFAGEQGFATDNAVIDARFFGIVVDPGEGPFGTTILGNFVLLGGKALPKLFFSKGLLGHTNNLVVNTAGVLNQVDVI